MSPLLFTALMFAAATPPPENAVWPRPVIRPAPSATAGARQPVVSLNGVWKISAQPPAEFWNNAVDPSSWTDVRVPAHISTQGIAVPRSGGEYAYKTRFTVPADYSGKRIFVKFHGVTGQARAWVNGVFLRDHFGGFTTWDCDITEHVKPGQQAWLVVAIDDTRRGLSGYNNGGILRDVELMAVPQDHLTRFTIDTDLDGQYRNAVLKVWIAMAFHAAPAARVELSLKDPRGRAVPLRPNTVELTREQPERIVEIPVAAPVKWDAEHPNLYTLEARLPGGTVMRRVGFREVERSGKKLLVNGKEVKLRGVNRKDIYPLTGRSVPVEFREMDVRLFRDANINYIRTSHYPTHQEFLDACDRLGMYVESETSVSMSRDQAVNNPQLTPLYLSQLAEMIERDRSHPSVIIWSLGNESSWGSNIAKEAEYMRAEDTSRPVKFSWSFLVPPAIQPKVFDLYSFHYPYWERDLAAGGPLPGGSHETSRQSGTDPSDFPVLHDEYAHIASYIAEDLRRDPNIANFWGETIKRMWERIFVREGALGGAIWGSVDNSSIVPDDRFTISRSDWGIIDGWRRPKAEYWLTKKAYSPVRIDEKPLANPGVGKPMVVPVKNWFDHTDLKELRAVWSIGKATGQLELPSIAPHAEGSLRLPARTWKSGDVVNLRFYRTGDIMVDEYNLTVDPSPPSTLPDPIGPAPKIETAAEKIVVTGADFRIEFSREMGLITSGTYKGTRLIESGPYLNLVGQDLGAWSLREIGAKQQGSEAVVSIAGAQGAVTLEFEVRIDGRGLVTTRYKLGDVPPLKRRLIAEGYQRDVGGYSEVGVSYILSRDVDRLSWKRKGLWSAYPEDHLGRTAGIAMRTGRGSGQSYGDKPEWAWSEDERDFTLFGRYDAGGRGTRDFRAMKENIYHASALLRSAPQRVQALSEGTNAVRLEALPDEKSFVLAADSRVVFTGGWTPNAAEMRSTNPGAAVEFTFKGTGIAWYGVRGGTADIYVDGKPEKLGLGLAVRRFGPPGAPPRPGAQQPSLLYSKTGLPDGNHTIRIALAAGGQAGSFISLDRFQVLGPDVRGPVRFIINNEWNTPNFGWGNYVKDPVLVGKGYTNVVRFRFSDKDE